MTKKNNQSVRLKWNNIVMQIHLVMYTYSAYTHKLHAAYVPLLYYYYIYSCCSDLQVTYTAHTETYLYVYLFASLNLHSSEI